jgi:hypothetical protein
LRPAFVHQILDPEPAERDAAARLAQAGGGAPRRLPVEPGRGGDQLGHGHAAPGDLGAARDLGEERAQPVLRLEGRDLHPRSARYTVR